MKHIRTRIWGTLLCLAMLLSLLPTVALASSHPNCSGNCDHEAAIGTTHYDTIGEALRAAGGQTGSGGTVKLLKNSFLHSNDSATTGTADMWSTFIYKDVTLDLNKKTLTCNAEYVGISVQPGVKFTIQNGVFENTSKEQWATAIEASKDENVDGNGCTIIVNNATIKANYGVYAVGYTKVEVINGSAIEGKYPVYGAGPANKVTLKGATITGSVYGVYQGPYDPTYFENEKIDGSVYKIYNSTITGTYAGICINNYLGDVAKESHTLLVDNSSVTGGSGIETKRTDVTITGENTEIIATGDEAMNPDGSPVSSGYALAVTYYSKNNVVVGHGKTEGDDHTAGTLNITGGAFDGAIGIQKPVEGVETEATLAITGGVFSHAPDKDYLGSGSYLVTVDNDNGDPVTNTVVSGSFTLPAAPTKANFVFLGWLSSADGKEHEAAESVPIGKNTTFTAQWVPSHYTVTFHSNGGSTVASQSVAYNQMASVPIPAPVRTGYAFQGWYTDAACTQTYDFNTPVTGNLTLYAGWAYIPPADPSYRITIADAAHGTVTADPAAARQGATVTLTVTPEEGYAVDEITVTDFFGSRVEVSRNSNGTYSFVMPASQVTVSAVFAPAQLPFTDVTEANWYYDEVYYVWANGLMQGTSAATFGPNVDTTRAMVVTILWRLEGEPASGYDMDYSDVAGGAWYADAVRWATEHGIVNGSEGQFYPGGIVTREQLAAMLYRYAQYKGYDLTAGGDLSGFADAGAVSGWAETSLAWAVGQRLIQGSANQIDPTGSAIRAQLAAILMRFCENVAEV